MLKVFATQSIVSKGYDGAAILRFSEKGDSVRFRIGKKVYDSREENNSRWINLSVKAFGPVCDRIKKMQLKEGSCINLIGRLDEDTWTDKNTGETKSAMVIVLDDIEYASGKSKSGEGQPSNDPAGGQPYAAPQPAPAAAPAATTGEFTGFTPFGAGSFFDEG